MQHFEVYGRKTCCGLEENGVAHSQGHPDRTDGIVIGAVATIDRKAVAGQDAANFNMKVAWLVKARREVGATESGETEVENWVSAMAYNGREAPSFEGSL